MRRREFLSLLGGAAAAWPRAARAQQRVPVIAYLSSVSSETEARLRTFQLGLKESGYIQGENVAIEYHFANNQMDRVPALTAELVRRRVAVIIASSAPTALVAAKATKTIPIVFMVAEDPVGLGLVASLARPGGNATGVNFFLAELVAKRLGLLRELIPLATRVALLINPAETSIAETTVRDAEPAARAMGLQLQILKATDSSEINAAFAVLAQQRPDGLFIASGPLFGARRVQLVNLASRYAMPTIYAGRESAEVGGLISYGTNATERFHQTGVYTGRILKGAKPTDLPVVQSSKYELVINAESARLLGLTLPPGLLAIADEVIE